MDDIATIDETHIVALFNPDEAAIRRAAAAGMRTLVNFCGAGEKGLSPAEEERVAEDAGMNYLNVPVAADRLDDAQVDEFRRSLDDLPEPVFLHCASGKRAGAMTLMALAADKGWDGDTALEEGRKRGLDLSAETIGRFVKDYADRKAAG